MLEARRPPAGRAGRLQSAAAPTPSACSIRSSTTASVKMVGVEAGGHGVDAERACRLADRRPPGVLHGNRTYLLQDADGQIIEGHSISAGLDYPGVGPEHSWLNEIGRVEYVPVTDEEALDAFQLLPAARRHHPGAGAGACAGPCRSSCAPTMAQGPDHRHESLRPRRQGHLHRRRASGSEAVTPRIDSRFARAEGAKAAPALSPSSRRGDPDLRDLAGDPGGLPGGGRRRDRARHALHRPDGRRPGDPGRRPARAEGRRTRWPRRSRWCGRSARTDNDDADRADGLLQPDLCLWRRRASSPMRRRRRRRADRRRPAAGGRRRAAACRR